LLLPSPVGGDPAPGRTEFCPSTRSKSFIAILAGGLGASRPPLPGLGGQQFPETLAATDEVLRQRILRKKAGYLLLPCIGLDPAPLLDGPPALNTRRRSGRKPFNITHRVQQLGNMSILYTPGAVVRFRMIAENRDPVLALAHVVAHTVYPSTLVVAAMATGRLHGLEVCHSVADTRKWPDSAASV